MSKSDGSERPSSSPRMVDSALHFKKRHEFCFVVDGVVMETMWQIGQGRIFLEKGTKKATKRSEYLGYYSYRNGLHHLEVVEVSPIPTHTPRTTRFTHACYPALLALGYAHRRGLNPPQERRR